LVDAPTGCKDRQAALAVLADLERTAERVKAKVVTREDLDQAARADTPLAEHISAYEEHLESSGVTAVYRKDVLAAVRRVFGECQFMRVADLNRGAVEQWLSARLGDGMSARSRNAYRNAVVAFCNWGLACDPPRMRAHPFAAIPKANEKADPRRKRRSMTEDELVRLLAVAVVRPLSDARTIRRGKRRGSSSRNSAPRRSPDCSGSGENGR
jgi:hypothetical protein